MKRISLFFLTCTLAVSIAVAQDNRESGLDVSVIEGAYFGQNPPGLVPEIFAPGIVSVDGRFEGAVSFSPDLKEIYFGAYHEGQETAIYGSKLEGNEWTQIEKLNFTNGRKKEEMHPFVSPDGQRIYFTALDSSFADEQIWYVDRLENSWSEAKALDSPVNDDLVFFPNQSKNGDMYYFNLTKFKTFYSPSKNGEFPETHEVELEFGHHACVSPSQDYILVTARSNEGEGREDNDIYVYFRNADGTWSKPINPGSKVNSTLGEKGPRITPDGRYLFFGRSERPGNIGLANIYWVDTQVIRNLRPQE